MSCLMKPLFALLILAILIPAGASGQAIDSSRRSSIGLRIGYLFTAGEWNSVRYAPEIRFLKGGFSVGADFEIPLTDKLSLAIDGGYQPLDGSDWEAYARSRGDEVAISAAFVYLGVLLRPYLKAGGPDIFWCEFGPAVLFPGGEERFNGAFYTYDFFNSTRFGGEGAVAYGRMLSDQVAVSLRIAGMVIPSGISYADGESRTLIAFPLTLGLRFTL